MPLLSSQAPSLAVFDSFVLDISRFELRRAGHVVRLERRVFDLLAYLLTNRDRVVSKQEILRELWQGRAVSDASLGVAISAARRAIDDDPTRQAKIRTAYGRGYQFVAPVSLAATPQAVESPHLSAIVGRADEISALKASLDLATTGHCRVALLRGPPGIGKSRLLQYLRDLVARTGFMTCCTYCIENHGAPTFSPWTHLLRQLVASIPPTKLDALPHFHRQTLGLLLPEFADDADQAALGTKSSDYTTNQYRLFDSISVLFEHAFRVAPIAILIDDIHRADLPSLNLAYFLSREFRDHPFLLVLTLRDTELAQRPSSFVEITKLARDAETLELTLDGLDELETSQLLAQTANTTVSPELAAVIYHKTCGNPFFVKQLASLLPPAPDARGEPTLPPLPRGLREAILQQLDLLAPSALRLLRVAAVAGPAFEAKLLKKPGDLTSAQIADALRESVAAGILREDRHRPGFYTFDHVLVRDALYDGLPGYERAQIHISVAIAIEEHHASAIEPHYAELAHHFFEGSTAGAANKGLEYSLLAAEAAASQFAYEEAARLYSRALKLLEIVEPSNHARRVQHLLRLGSAQLHARDRVGAQASFRSAARLARKLGAAKELAAAALGASPGFFAIEAGNVDFFLIDLLEEAIDMLESNDPALEARLLARLAMALHWSDTDRRVTLSRRACDIAEQTGDAKTCLYVLHARWLAEWSKDNFEERYELAKRLVHRAEELKERELLLVCRLFLLVGLLERGEMEAFDRELSIFTHLVVELRQPHTLWYPPLFSSMRALMEGRFSKAPRLVRDLAVAAARVQDANALHSLMAHNLALRSERGGLEEIVEGVRQACSRYPNMYGWRAALAWILCRTGLLSEGRAEFDRIAARDFRDVSQQFDWTAAIGLSAEVCWMLGDSQRAEVLYGLLEPLAQRFIIMGLGVVNWGSVERSLGLLAMVRRDLEAAERHFLRAIERNASVRARTWVVHSEIDRAELLVEGGFEQEAAELLMQTLSEARDLRMEHASRRGSAIVARLNHPVRSRETLRAPR